MSITYEHYILKKSNHSKEDFNHFLSILREEIEIIPQKKIYPFIQKAEKFSLDPKDTIYLAYALTIEAKIWSNDKKLKEDQDEVEIITTEELIDKVGFVK